MKEIEASISVYERLRAKQYRITISELGKSFLLCFKPKHYHHLIGFQHLTDLPDIASCPKGTSHFYRLLKNKTYREDAIRESTHFSDIHERITSFSRVERLLTASKAKIIIDFDPTKADSQINARFLLFEREGKSFAGEAITYYNLFIGYNDRQDYYYPATYIVEHSRKYQSEQNYLECAIEEVPLGKTIAQPSAPTP